MVIESPLVSILVASYNNATFIQQSLDSVAAQTYQNIELIIVDDCSKDDSVAVIESWIERNDYKCKFIANPDNKGVCRVSNIFLENCHGKYISWLASDDIMLPGKIETQVGILENAASDVGLVYSDAYIIDKHGKKYFSKFIQWHRQFIDIPQGDVFETLLNGNFIPVMTTLIKKECFNKCGYYDENLIYEDYDMLLRIAKEYKFIFSDYISTEYRMHDNNLHKKLASIPALETNYALFYKHLGISEKIDSIIKISLLYFINQMNDLKSHNINHYLKQYNKIFNKSKIINFLTEHKVSYSNINRANRLIKLIETSF